jgi:hypothetical protein
MFKVYDVKKVTLWPKTTASAKVEIATTELRGSPYVLLPLLFLVRLTNLHTGKSVALDLHTQR